ncbi:alpha/beta hydrolase fold [Streptomyces sp. Ag82_O1-12]|uniref:alpha/beta hydrolase n=1 Tax=unclassified Streptomyces TaxID=2593676 RepID=UPI000BD38F30|nr:MULTISPECIES: alpha/beta hydrolase [unclassified Streptomyces]SMQ16164.1 alpha/beta hydrolase fold [Streptomyces sp. Ag82_O1-12]SOD45193.1 alpha/beta hydrolase fold [Streptomyces sp. Ag82_G6-1]
MKQIKRNASLIAASALLWGLAVPLTASAADAGPLRWTKCEGTGLDPRQQCATLSVPMSYADPGGRKIDIALSRLPSQNPSARRGALLMIPGGPGGDSLAGPSEEGRQLPRSVRDAYDLIGFAPRGNSPSTAVSCGIDHSDLARTKLLPWPAASGSVAENMATARRLSDACAREGDELLRHISTKNNARDIDRIRAALGERKLSAWGVSYGTYVGAAYLEMFPRRTDRIVLDSNDHPDPAQAQRAWLAAFEVGVEDNFPEFATWASRPGNPYRLARTAAEVRPLFLRLAARLDRTPIPWPGANPEELNGNVLRQTMLDAFYDPADGYPVLAELIRAAKKGTVPPAPQAPPDSALRNYAAVVAATLCNDAAWPRSAAAYRKDVAAARLKYPLTAGMPRNAMVCAAWPWQPKEPPVRVTDRGPSHVLLIQNERDVATPLSGALKLREALGRRAVMVTNDATGHGAYLDNGTACGDALVSRFLATGERPRTDAYCG